MAKKVAKWYGIKTFNTDLTVVEMEVAKETERRIYPTPKQQEKSTAWNRAWLYKTSGYERWYPTREEAFNAKLERMEASLSRKKEDVAQITRLISDFKKQEKL